MRPVKDPDIFCMPIFHLFQARLQLGINFLIECQGGPFWEFYYFHLLAVIWKSGMIQLSSRALISLVTVPALTDEE